jgi:hypothetical protein
MWLMDRGVFSSDRQPAGKTGFGGVEMYQVGVDRADQLPQS